MTTIQIRGRIYPLVAFLDADGERTEDPDEACSILVRVGAQYAVYAMGVDGFIKKATQQ